MSRRVVRPRRRAERGAWLPARPGRAGRLPADHVLYDRDPRAAGTGKYNRFFGSLRIGMNGIVGFSRYPLHLISSSVSCSRSSRSIRPVYFILKFAGVPFPTGNPTIVILISFFSGIQLLSLGVMGEYVGRIYDEVKHRPAFIVESDLGFEPLGRPRPRGCVGRAAPVLSCRRSRRSAILAGGLGTRLGERTRRHAEGARARSRTSRSSPISCDSSPAMAPTASCSASASSASAIEAALGDGVRFGLDVRYSYDGDEPAGTAGAMRRALPLLGRAVPRDCTATRTCESTTRPFRPGSTLVRDRP